MKNWKTTLWTAAAPFGLIGLSLLIPARPATAQIVHNNDVIIDGSLCVGFDCFAGISFGFSTEILRENNLRIRFDDTSVAASFPNNDWEILVNDSANGGLNRFSIQDVTAGRLVTTIESGAPEHSLYIDDGGRVGFGTSQPVVDLHVKSGNTPTLRLEQDGSAGFTPQTWDVAGNEANFFIRDATSGSTLPFRIRPGSNTGVIDINDGTARFGTTSVVGVLGTTDLSILVGSGPSGIGGPARIGFEAGAEDFALVADPGSGNLIYASTTTPGGILVIDGDGLAPGAAAGTDLCVGTGNVLCLCGSCP